MRIFLTGFMGSGKTTVGRRLAERLELPFVDLDEEIERRAGMAVREIFERQGEPAFRALEAEALRQVLALPDVVVATGGGTMAFEGNFRLIRASGLVVAATDVAAWLSGWTRRDLLGFLGQCGVGARNSWSKERLAEVAQRECPEPVTQRMVESGAVQLAPQHLEGARQLRHYLRRVRETWRVWLAFGTGV